MERVANCSLVVAFCLSLGRLARVFAPLRLQPPGAATTRRREQNKYENGRYSFNTRISVVRSSAALLVRTLEAEMCFEYTRIQHRPSLDLLYPIDAVKSLLISVMAIWLTFLGRSV